MLAIVWLFVLMWRECDERLWLWPWCLLWSTCMNLLEIHLQLVPSWWMMARHHRTMCCTNASSDGCRCGQLSWRSRFLRLFCSSKGFVVLFLELCLMVLLFWGVCCTMSFCLCTPQHRSSSESRWLGDRHRSSSCFLWTLHYRRGSYPRYLSRSRRSKGILI